MHGVRLLNSRARELTLPRATDDSQRTACVDEARVAFARNVDVYGEDGSLATDAARGVFNVARGFVRSRVGGA